VILLSVMDVNELTEEQRGILENFQVKQLEDSSLQRTPMLSPSSLLQNART
jgi:hypothetical protein